MKKVVFIGASLLVGGLIYAYEKSKQVTTVLNNLKIVPTGFDDFQIKEDHIHFLLDMNIINESPVDFSFSTGNIVTLNKILIYTKEENLLATGDTSVSAINLPPYGSMPVPGIIVKVPKAIITQTIIDLILGQKLDKLKVKVQLTYLGKTKII